MSDYRFETLQLHVGQETPDPATDARAVPICGGSCNLLAHTLPGFGITAGFVNIHHLAETEAAIRDNTRAIYIGTLGNPNSDIPDIDTLPDHRLYEKYFPSGAGSIFTFEITGGVKEAQL